MNGNSRRIGLFAILAAGTLFSAELTGPALLQSDSGSIAFEVETNMPGVEVRGKSSSLSARVEVVRESGRLSLHKIDASVAVNTLATGMKTRDEHMRKYIFRTGDGQEPDLRFTGEDGACEKTGSARDYVCRIPGELSIRGVSKPLALTLHAREQGSSSDAFRAVGEALVKLSTYGIPTPSQFGVKPADDVKIHLDFTARIRPAVSAGVVQ